MWEKFKQYWQKGFGSKIAVVLSAAILTFLLVSIVGGYTDSYYFSWVGVGNYYPPHGLKTDAERGKTLWDWMGLLIIPAVLVIGGYWLNKIERDREVDRREEERQREEKRKNRREAEAADQIKENEWQIYLDKIANLLEKGLREEDINSPKMDIARVRTLTTLRRLDGSRKGMLLRFLFEAGLITPTPRPVVALIDADFSEADLRGAVLTASYLQTTDKPKGTYRRAIDPEVAKEFGIDLSNTLKIEADLSGLPPRLKMMGAVLVAANLSKANLTEALLIGANLSDVRLVNANLNKAVLSTASLRGANLSEASLREAKLYGSDLRDAHLKGANLEGAAYNGATQWPEGFNPEEAGAKEI